MQEKVLVVFPKDVLKLFPHQIVVVSASGPGSSLRHAGALTRCVPRAVVSHHLLPCLGLPGPDAQVMWRTSCGYFVLLTSALWIELIELGVEP